MKLRKRFLAILLAVAVAAAFSSCSSGSGGSARQDSGKKIGYQLETPAQGEEIAVLTTSMGAVKIRLFPEAAPKAVENFKGLIRKGYYNGLTFHRVIKDFMVQTGDPTGTGRGGESIWSKSFADEFNANLLNVRGAVAMANSGKNTNGSQFFIDQAGPGVFQGWTQYEQAYSYFKQSKMTADDFTTQYGSNWINMDKATDEYRTFYEKHGGNPYLDGFYNLGGKGHTVFGQVFEGMDIVDKIASVEVDSGNKPVLKVTIVKAEIVKYGK
jgi:cyclophilin family peptidyl-prolyl cis-trans isomerase